MVISMSTSLGSQFSNFCELFNQDPIYIGKTQCQVACAWHGGRPSDDHHLPDFEGLAMSSREGLSEIFS
jgi:hypothetical protein